VPSEIPLARFPQDSLIAKLDSNLSAALSAVPLLEYALFLPAHAFGAPLFSLGVLPCAFAALAHPDPLGSTPDSRLAIGAAAAAAAALLLCATGVLPHTTFNKGWHIGVAAAASLLGLHRVSTPGFRAACLYLVAWLVVTGVVWILKGFVARPRPGAVLAREGPPPAPGPAPPLPPRWLRAPFAARRAGWPRTLDAHAALPNAAHSFPSMDAACAGVFAAVARAAVATSNWPRLATASLPVTALAALVGAACVGRVYFFAHHVLDTLVGAAIGFGFATGLALAVPSAEAWPWMLLWAVACPLALRSFFAAARAQVFVALCGVAALVHASPVAASTATPALFAALCATLAAAFHQQSAAVKPPVLACLDAAWASSSSSSVERALPAALAAAIRRKRDELREQSRGGTTFPGNVHRDQNCQSLSATFYL
jgi:hypothetical protein